MKLFRKWGLARIGDFVNKTYEAFSKAGEFIYKQGESNETVYILKEGRVQLDVIVIS